MIVIKVSERTVDIIIEREQKMVSINKDGKVEGPATEQESMLALAARAYLESKSLPA
jgi:hypothetical protein